MTNNVYLTKICALLKAPIKKSKVNLSDLYSAKISLEKKLKDRKGEGTHRQHRHHKTK